MHSDEQLETYLNAVAEYEALKTEASDAWKGAFMELAKAKLTLSVSSQDHDPTEPAATTLQDGRLLCGPSQSMLGIWPTPSLLSSQKDFVLALQCETQCWALAQKIKKII